MRVIGETPRQTMGLGLIAIHSGQPLRSIVDRRQDVRRGRALNRSPVDPGLRIHTQSGIEWRSGAAQIAESAEVQVQPWIIREKRAQPGNRVPGGDLHRVVAGGMTILLLESGKEE